MEWKFIPVEIKFKLIDTYRDLIIPLNIVRMKWGRNAMYLKAMNDLEVATLRLNHMTSTQNFSEKDQVIEDLRCTTKELETALGDIGLRYNESFHEDCGVLAEDIMFKLGYADKQTLVTRYRLLFLEIEWDFHFQTCYYGHLKDLVEQRILGDYQIHKKYLSKIPSFMLEEEFRKQKFFQENDSDKSIIDVNKVYEKLYPVMIKCAVLYLRDGVNETTNKMRDGLESVSAQILRMMIANDLTDLHRPFNNLILLEKEFESVLQTIDIHKYKFVFDEWETRKDHPGEPRQCENFAKAFNDFNKRFHEEAYTQHEFVSAMRWKFLERSYRKNVKRSLETDLDETEVPLREENHKCVEDDAKTSIDTSAESVKPSEIH